MMTTFDRQHVCSRLIVRVFCAMAVVAFLPALAYAAPSPLPPRPEPPSPSPVVAPGEEPGGGVIELLIPLASGRWHGEYWQGLWTIVQWKDSFGGWHDVEGWRGTPDEVVDGEGKKVWWVGKADLGTGPFRWLIYQSQKGKLLAQSQPFYLPHSSGETVKVEVSLTP